MHKGIRPTNIDPRDKRFSFHKLFGVASSFPDSYNASDDIFPDQNKDNRGSECTGYTITEIGRIEDGTEYSPEYNFMKTLEIMGLPPETSGADARTAFKIACTFGMLPKTLVPKGMQDQSQAWAANQSNWPLTLDKEASKNAKPAYTPIAPVPDYFDAIRSALLLGSNTKKTVGMATEWSPSFESLQTDAILPDDPINLDWGHMYQIVGWKTIYGMPYLMIKSWQGKEYGDGGYCYMSRKLCNMLLARWGAYAASLEKLSQGTIDELKAEEATWFEIAIALAQNLVINIKYDLSH